MPLETNLYEIWAIADEAEGEHLCAVLPTYVDAQRILACLERTGTATSFEIRFQGRRLAGQDRDDLRNRPTYPDIPSFRG